MKAKVEYNDEGEATGFKVRERGASLETTYSMQGTSAVLTSIHPPEDAPRVYVDEVSAHVNYAETLPFVQAVTLDEYSGEQE